MKIILEHCKIVINLVLFCLLFLVVSGCGGPCDGPDKNSEYCKNLMAEQQPPNAVNFSVVCLDDWVSPSTSCSGTCASHLGENYFIPNGPLSACPGASTTISTKTYVVICNKNSNGDYIAGTTCTACGTLGIAMKLSSVCN